jgi:glucokinase
MKRDAILVGDAGGTNVRFALAQADDGRVSVTDIWKQPGAGFPTFEAAMQAYLAEAKPPLAGAAFGVAGAIREGRTELLHRGWRIDRRALAATLNVERVVLVNDFFAMARGAPEVAASEIEPIAPGEPDPEGAAVVGGPGTGLGIGVLRRVKSSWIVVAGEGGHQAYGPQTEIEWKVAEALRRRGIYVSNEIVAAGAGFSDTRAALAEVMGVPDRDLSQADVIAAAKQGDAFALEFCRLRARTVMTALGNSALAAYATGGVFVAGGVSQRLLPWLKEREALDRFYQRGPRTELLSKIPLQLITSETAPLIGAAHLWLDEQARGWL